MVCLLFAQAVYATDPGLGITFENAARIIPFIQQKDMGVDLNRYHANSILFSYSDNISVKNSKPPEGGYLISQFLIAGLGGALGTAAGVNFSGVEFSDDEEGSDFVKLVGFAYAGYALGVATGVHVVGIINNKDLPFLRALMGSAIGTSIGLGAIIAGQGSEVANVGAALTFLLPIPLSMILYNKGNTKSHGPEISTGQLGYYQDACGGPGVKIDLLSCRF